MTTKEKLVALRRLMAERGLAAYLVPSTDPHQSEYVPECWQRRCWLSGFTGSAGELLVLGQKAGLWTDGRYFLQAEAELKGSGIDLYKMGQPKVPTLAEMLTLQLKPGQFLGIDPQLVSVARAKNLEEVVQSAGAQIRWVAENLVDLLWHDRPSVPVHPVRSLAVQFAGESVASKLRRLRKEMKEKKLEAHPITALDAVAWLFNIRGRDTDYNPIAISSALVTQSEAFLFIPPEKVPAAVVKALAPAVQVRPYEEMASRLGALAERRAGIWLDENATSRWVLGLLEGCRFFREASPVFKMKAKKNPVEIAGMRAAHLEDGLALVRFLRWLEEEVPKGTVTEIAAENKLEELRSAGKHFQGSSFHTISGYGAHGASPHYSATEKSNARLRPEGFYVLDSGGQYLTGTTDTTRTVFLGKRVSKEQKEQFTRVLRGHIALARASFPEGVRGVRLDTYARQPLWEAGLDYNHGTGHGIGHFLCVHEGPQSISSRETNAALEPGNILSNEPGYYVAGAYGIRTETNILVVEDPKRSGNGWRFLTFETLTLCPIDTRPVEPKLLSEDERRWLNQYHKTVYTALAPRLEPADRSWLKKACAAI